MSFNSDYSRRPVKSVGRTGTDMRANILLVLAPFFIYIIVRLLAFYFAKTGGFLSSIAGSSIGYAMSWYLSVLFSVTGSALIAVIAATVIYFILKSFHMRENRERAAAYVILIMLACIIFMNLMPNFSGYNPMEWLRSIKSWLWMLLLLFSGAYIIAAWCISEALANMIKAVCFVVINVLFLFVSMAAGTVPFAGSIVSLVRFIIGAVVFGYVFMLTGLANIAKGIVDGRTPRR